MPRITSIAQITRWRDPTFIRERFHVSRPRAEATVGERELHGNVVRPELLGLHEGSHCGTFEVLASLFAQCAAAVRQPPRIECNLEFAAVPL